MIIQFLSELEFNFGKSIIRINLNLYFHLFLVLLQINCSNPFFHFFTSYLELLWVSNFE